MKTFTAPLTMRGTLVLIAVLISVSALLSFSANFDGDRGHLSLRRSPKFRDYPAHHPFEKRNECENADDGGWACAVCGPPVVFTGASSIAARAGYHNQARAHNASALHITERTITEPAPGKEDGFMVGEIPKATQMVWEVNGGDVNTAKFFTWPADRALSIGTSHLCGCTSMVIISRRGVYVTHYWESISFAPENHWRLSPEETDDELFERTVIEPIQKGKNGGAPGYPLEQNKLESSRIGNRERDNIRAFLVRPNTAFRLRLMSKYEQKWALIKKTVGGIVRPLDPTTQAGSSKWQEIIYRRLDNDDDALNDLANGKVLVKYDPDHEGKKKVILWVEKNKVYEDEWDY